MTGQPTEKSEEVIFLGERPRIEMDETKFVLNIYCTEDMFKILKPYVSGERKPKEGMEVLEMMKIWKAIKPIFMNSL